MHCIGPKNCPLAADKKKIPEFKEKICKMHLDVIQCICYTFKLDINGWILMKQSCAL